MFDFDFSQLFTLNNLFMCALGSFVGLLVGAMPGMGTVLAIVLLLPFTYTMEPLTAILILLCAYQGAEYGGSISSITLGIPGTPSAAATTIDGFALAKKGQPGKALSYSLEASVWGGILGALALLFLTEPLARFSLRFNAPDFCMLGFAALFAIVTISSKELIKGLIAVFLGLMLSTVGTDVFTGAARYTYGVPALLDGVYTVSMAIGVFAIPEIIAIVEENLHTKYVPDGKKMITKLTMKERLFIMPDSIYGSIIGTIIGIFPGLGSAISAWMALLFTQKTAKNGKFGEGDPRGIASPEAANNACVAGSLIPELALGIPGSSAIAVIAAAFMVHGIKVGPSLFENDPQLLYGIYFGFFLSIIAMYLLGKFMTPFFSKLLTIEGAVLVPIILVFLILGSFTGKRIFVHLWVALILGVICYFLKRAKFPLAPIMIAYVIGPMIEQNFRRSLDLSKGSLSIFVQSGLSKIIFAILVFVVVFPLLKVIKRMIFKPKGMTIEDLGDGDG